MSKKTKLNNMNDNKSSTLALEKSPTMVNLFTLSQVLQLTKLSQNKILKMNEDGSFPCFKIENGYHFWAEQDVYLLINKYYYFIIFPNFFANYDLNENDNENDIVCEWETN